MRTLIASTLFLCTLAGCSDDPPLVSYLLVRDDGRFSSQETCDSVGADRLDFHATFEGSITPVLLANEGCGEGPVALQEHARLAKTIMISAWAMTSMFEGGPVAETEWSVADHPFGEPVVLTFTAITVQHGACKEFGITLKQKGSGIERRILGDCSNQPEQTLDIEPGEYEVTAEVDRRTAISRKPLVTQKENAIDLR